MMKILLKILVLSVTLMGIKGQTVMEKYYDQRLDHGGSAMDTWKQRYFENREFFKPNGPVFVSFGGPWWYGLVGPENLQKGSMVQYAKEQGAALFLLELRYYGKSRPTSDLSTENFGKYFTVENNVEDVAKFIKWLRSQPDLSKSKVVAFGKSYIGTRLTQIMRNQPGVIDIGILSSSIVEARFEFPSFMKNAVDLMRKSNPSCTDTVHDAVLCFDKIVNGESCGGHNIKDMKQTFNLCTDVDGKNNLDSAALVGEMLIQLSYVVLFNNPKAPYNLDVMCKRMADNSTGTHVERLANEIKTILKNNGMPCLEFKIDDIVSRLQSTQWDTPGTSRGDRQIQYSRCKYAMTLRTPEGLNLGAGTTESFRNYNLEICTRLFGLTPAQVKAGSEMSNELYGKRRIPEKCAIFVSEGEDLIQEIEITKQSEAGKCNQVVRSEGGSFNADESEIDAEVGKGVKEAKLRVGKLIDTWLKTGDCCAPVAKRIDEYRPVFFDVLGKK